MVSLERDERNTCIDMDTATIQRDGALDFLKVVATAIIILHHYTQVVYVSGKGFFFGGAFYWGRMVELFFIISGYLMYKYEDIIRGGGAFLSFYVKRALRLLPMVALAAIVYEIEILLYKYVTGTLYHKQVLKLSGMLFDMLGIQDGWASHNPMVNNPTWYVSVLLLCYIWFYVMNQLSAKWNINICWLYLFMIFIGIGILSYNIRLPFLNTSAARGYYAFFTGALLSHFTASDISKSKRTTIVAAALVVFTAFIVIWYGKTGRKWDDYYWLTFVTFPALIIIARTGFCQMLFRSSIYRVLAAGAFNAYIWHACIYIVWKIMLLKVPYLAAIAEWKMMLINLAATLLFGLISHYMIENPFNKWICAKTTVFIERGA